MIGILKDIIAVLLSFPELIAFAKTLNRQIAKSQREAKLKSDIKSINEAFKNKDAKLLNDIFNS